MGQELSLQQAHLSSVAAVSLAETSFFFIGQDSPLQQQHAAAVSGRELMLQAEAAMASADTITAMIANITIFPVIFMINSLF
jgi:hypothetical protein